MNRALPLISGTLILLLATTLTLWVSLQATGGTLTYPLDDAYIGMAIAKNLSQHGIWGTSLEFASAASSPGFILLLSTCYLITGPNIYWPLILATGGAIAALFAAAWIARDAAQNIRIAGVVAVAVFGPLHIMALIGMEHSIHTALSLIFVAVALPVISKQRPLSLAVLTIAALMVLFRYEGLFVVAGACLLLLAQRRCRAALTLATAAGLPVLAFAVYFKAHGGGLFPNSLLLKGGPAGYKLFDFLREGLYAAPLIFVITMAMRKCWRPPYSPAAAALGITTIAFWLHLTLARFGWVYRYEAYLLAMAVISLTLMLAERWPMAIGPRVALGFLMIHSVFATLTIPERCRAIYSQQCQTAKLASLMGDPIAVNDVGAPAYFTDVPVVDLVGLGTQEIANARSRGQYTTVFMRDLLSRRAVKVLAIYDSWFDKGSHPYLGGPPIPEDFIRVATMYTPAPGGYLGDNTISYYAAPGTEKRLCHALERIRPSLPTGNTLTITAP